MYRTALYATGLLGEEHDNNASLRKRLEDVWGDKVTVTLSQSRRPHAIFS